MRIHYNHTHTVGCSQEVPLLIEAGFQVLPGIGAKSRLYFDTSHDLEMGYFATDWTINCDLPASIAQKLREIDIERQRGEVTTEQQELLNRYCDAIFTLGIPDTIKALQKWFKGRLICRVPGYSPGPIRFAEQLKASDVTWDERMIYSPSAVTLLEEPDYMLDSMFLLHGIIDERRMHYKWAGIDSREIISTCIPYLHLSDNLREWCKEVSNTFSAMPFEICGKNDKSSPFCADPRILGGLSEYDFFYHLATARCFAEWSPMYYHQRFTPLEAVFTGVPLFFLSKSGLKKTCEYFGAKIVDETIGCFPDGASMQKGVTKLFSNIEGLKALHERQAEFLKTAFSRERVLGDVRAFLKRLGGKPNYAPHPPRAFRSFFQRDFPRHINERVRFDANSFLHRTGHLVVTQSGSQLEYKAQQSPTSIVSEYFPDSLTGKYHVEFEYEPLGAPKGKKVAGVEFVIWGTDDRLLAEAFMLGGQQKTVFEFEMKPPHIDCTREFRFGWFGSCDFIFKSVTFTRIA